LAIVARKTKYQKGTEEALLEGVAHITVLGKHAVIFNKGTVAEVGNFVSQEWWIQTVVLTNRRPEVISKVRVGNPV
jgi:hypothetical protein